MMYYSCRNYKIKFPVEEFPIVKPNRITGEGRTKFRASFYKNKTKDLKKKEHRKMAKKSKRLNRGKSK